MDRVVLVAYSKKLLVLLGIIVAMKLSSGKEVADLVNREEFGG